MFLKIRRILKILSFFLFFWITSDLAISESFKIIQSGVIDRENKIEMKKLREAMERLSGERIQDDFIDV